ncbi:MAG TPA: fumarylacetoacetate hydrolase family protein [Methylomirabilota bacterium]|jgi:fumarylacetoacetate (FAA) hydrolase family protein|nr:fumarylacetoacetate hydrolase family protein [Methylomirabilota bacterium]
MTSTSRLSATRCVPRDPGALLIGRAWIPAEDGPSVIALRGDDAVDLTRTYPTVSHLVNVATPGELRAAIKGAPVVTSTEALVSNSAEGTRDAARPWLLAPCDLQAVKASGVTFVASLLERVIEERARGNPALADGARREIQAIVGPDLRGVRPGSPEAARIKEVLLSREMWSQYLEVGIGPDAELFTKCPPMAAVGLGARVGVHPASVWSNPEPELVLVLNSAGAIAGVTLGNDVNLRDVEGRSALLLGRAKDNNASCAVGPFVRMLDDGFPLDAARRLSFQTTVEGLDGFRVSHTTHVKEISRDLADLAGQAHSRYHRYPDGVLLFIGTMFAPVDDRGVPGSGFTHKTGDVVSIVASELGALINEVVPCDEAEPWSFGTGALMANLARRGLLGAKT